MSTTANNADLDEMPYMVAFHPRLHCLLLKAKLIFRERNIILFGNYISCNPSIYTMNHPDLIASNFMENSIDLKRVKALVRSGL